MNADVYWLLELALTAGRLDEFRALMRDMVAAAGTETGTLNYEWNISDDGSVCHIYVRYRDPAAVMAHMHAFGSRFSARFLALAKITRLTVYGAPNDEVRQALAVYRPVYFSPLGGFQR
jgi:quinol monooxygenase YgiN